MRNSGSDAKAGIGWLHTSGRICSCRGRRSASVAGGINVKANSTSYHRKRCQPPPLLAVSPRHTYSPLIRRPCDIATLRPCGLATLQPCDLTTWSGLWAPTPDIHIRYGSSRGVRLSQLTGSSASSSASSRRPLPARPPSHRPPASMAVCPQLPPL